jgi:hypothetical protein
LGYSIDLDFFVQKMVEIKEDFEKYMKNTLALLSLTNKRAA